jgi:hypothetical protein
VRGLRSRRSPEGTGGDRPEAAEGRREVIRADRSAGATSSARAFALGGSTAAALAGLATFGLLAGGCSAGGTGMRDEGPAAPAPVERSMPTPTRTPQPPQARVDPVALLLSDPKVSDRIKAVLKPCSADAYPVNTSYGNLTGASLLDVVVNVMSCKDSIGIGTYVYRATSAGASGGSGSPSPGSRSRPVKPLPGNYVNVFTSEEPAIYATIDRGELVVTQQVYTRGDPVAYPSGEDVVTYGWSDSKFTERYRVRNNYSRSLGNNDLEDPMPAQTNPN